MTFQSRPSPSWKCDTCEDERKVREKSSASMKMTTKGPQCFAFNCFSYKNPHSKAKGITFHKFPNEKRNPDLFNRWVQNCRREKKPSPYSLLCSLHFEAQQFDRTGQTTRLREGTVPTIFTLPQRPLSPMMPQKTSRESRRGRVLGGTGRTKDKGRSRSPLAVEATHDAKEPHLESASETVMAKGHDSGDGRDVANVASANQQNKKMKVDTDLSPEEEQAMVEWLEVHPIFYNKNLTSYKDIAKKEMMWIEKAAEMGRLVADLKTWYSSLRSRFNRLKKKRCEDAEMTERDKWVIGHFDFLRTPVQKRTTVSELATTTIPIEVADIPDQPLEPVQSTPTPSTPPTLSAHKQIPEAEEALLAGLEEHSYQMISLQQPLLDRLGPVPAGDRKAFGKWVTSVINELDQDLWRRCQQEISNTLYRFIEENNQLKRQQPPAAAPALLTSSQSKQTSQLPQGSKGCRKQ